MFKAKTKIVTIFSFLFRERIILIGLTFYRLHLNSFDDTTIRLFVWMFSWTSRYFVNEALASNLRRIKKIRQIR